MSQTFHNSLADPIFELIERHRRAVGALVVAERAKDRARGNQAVGGLPAWLAATSAATAASIEIDRALIDLTIIAPTTVAGAAVVLLDYYAEMECDTTSRLVPCKVNPDGRWAVISPPHAGELHHHRGVLEKGGRAE
jgi:hypothetical protein